MLFIFGKENKLYDYEVDVFIEVFYVFVKFFGVVNVIDIFFIFKIIFFEIIKKVSWVGEIWDEIFERKFKEYVLIF